MGSPYFDFVISDSDQHGGCGDGDHYEEVDGIWEP